jgi:hypothetical protein
MAHAIGCAEFYSRIVQGTERKEESEQKKKHGFSFRVCLVAGKERAVSVSVFTIQHFKKRCAVSQKPVTAYQGHS